MSAAFSNPLDGAAAWLGSHAQYFFSATANNQIALTAFLVVSACLFFIASFARRRVIRRNRESIPLSIGGWGTRGKSGTERLKAGMFEGLGYEVVAKTTGCEAMFIHSVPQQFPEEIFVYRPYDKATIWEQADVLALGAALECEVFLWECMALNPRYVDLLENDWMLDDMVTLTNAYPDHEDIQGPSGYDVASVISNFIPRDAPLITSETNFLPLFAHRCKQQGAQMITVSELDGDLLADDLLDLFPYREHPRNIALVARMAQELGIDPGLAIVTMADRVVPDLGVLKTYPAIEIDGRRLAFANGMSANERTGFIGNWRRLGLDSIDMEQAPERVVIVVVNNRADRIARSEVFSRILARDVSCDRFVLIGTNLRGLSGYMQTAIDEYLSEQLVVSPDDLESSSDPEIPLGRLANQMKQLRVPEATADSLLARLKLYADGARFELTEDAMRALRERFVADLAAEGLATLENVRSTVSADKNLWRLVQSAIEPGRQTEDGAPESLADQPAVLSHFQRAYCRVLLRARLESQLRQVLAAGDPAGVSTYQAAFLSAYKELFWDQVVTVEDPGASGDQIIARCTEVIPPGTDATILGTQNIKGTGLDFVYRWLAIEKTSRAAERLAHDRADDRIGALTDLEAFEDFGLFDARLALAALARTADRVHTPREQGLRDRVKARLVEIEAARSRGLSEGSSRTLLDRVADTIESAIDYLDSAHRRRASQRLMKQLVAQRISHGRAAIEMRHLVSRQKGGWLAKSIRKTRLAKWLRSRETDKRAAADPHAG